MNQHINSTTSLSLAAYLETVGYDCVSITQSGAKPQLEFNFAISEDDFESHSDFFWSRKTEIDGLTYFEALKVLKSRIYQHKNKERTYEGNTSK